jgi:hypothetical protein
MRGLCKGEGRREEGEGGREKVKLVMGCGLIV